MAADFTWYLRNLLLVKSSEEMEDVLDVSTENLQKIREEVRDDRDGRADPLHPDLTRS